MARPDQLQLSLGPEKPRLAESLKELAISLDFPGRDGDGSISQLLIHLARAYEADAEAVTKLLDAAFAIADGADFDEVLDAL